MDNGQGLTDFTRQVINISTAISQSLSCITKNADEDYKLAVETSQRFRGGGTEIQLGGRGAGVAA